MLYHHRLWGLRHVNCQAYKSELTEFIELVQAGRDSELHRLEQKAMLRHPNVVRTTIAAEMSWKQGNTMEIAKDWVWVPWVTDVVRVGPGENQSGTLGKQDLNSMQLQKILVSVNSQLSSSFFPMIFMYFPLSKCAFRSLLSTLPFVSCSVAQVDSLLTRTPDGAVATKVDNMQRPEKLRRLDIVEEMRPTSSNDISKKKAKKKAYNVYIVAICCNMLQWFVCDTLLQIFACDLCNDIVRRLSYLHDLACRM